MSVGNFQVIQLPPDRVEITLVGVVTDATVKGLLEHLQARYSTQWGKLVLVELSGAREVAESARAPLILVQDFWKTRSRRSAWLADQSLMRGLALYVIHSAGDGNARVFSSRDQADEWFQVKEQRAESARQRTLAHLEDAKRALEEVRRINAGGQK